MEQPRPQASLVSFDVTLAVKLVGRTHPEGLTINGKFKWRSKAKCLASAKENGNHISFPPSTMLLKCSEGMYLTYTSAIFPDLRRKTQVFVEQYLGLFLVELELFCHFVPGFLAIALGPKPSPVIRIARIGLGTRLLLETFKKNRLPNKQKLLCLSTGRNTSFVFKKDCQRIKLMVSLGVNCSSAS